MSWVNNLIWQAQAYRKHISSFFKHDWINDDYPLRTNFHPALEPARPGQGEACSCSAMIYNWPGMLGAGNTKQEAPADVQRNFEEYKESSRKLPRPGTHVPIEFASSSRIDMHPEVRADFIRRILELPWAFLSDQSSLGDFHAGEGNDFLAGKIREVYGVDVSDITSGNLAEIFERIAKTKVT